MTGAPHDHRASRSPTRRRLDLSWPILSVRGAPVRLIVLPMSWLVYYSFTDKAGAFTLDNFVSSSPIRSSSIR